jgi:hypothetical protein
MTDEQTLAIFREGQEMAELGFARTDNPYTEAEAAAAWDAGWIEEAGDTFALSERTKRDRSGATLADVWPIDLRPGTS